MSWFDKFKKKPPLTNDEMLAKLDRIDTAYETQIRLCPPGSPFLEPLLAYQRMNFSVRKLVMIYIGKGEEVPPDINKTIRKLRVTD